MLTNCVVVCVSISEVVDTVTSDGWITVEMDGSKFGFIIVDVSLLELLFDIILEFLSFPWMGYGLIKIKNKIFKSIENNRKIQI